MITKYTEPNDKSSRLQTSKRNKTITPITVIIEKKTKNMSIVQKTRNNLTCHSTTTHHKNQLWNKRKYNYESWNKFQVFNTLYIPNPS